MILTIIGFIAGVLATLVALGALIVYDTQKARKAPRSSHTGALPVADRGPNHNSGRNRNFADSS